MDANRDLVRSNRYGLALRIAAVRNSCSARYRSIELAQDAVPGVGRGWPSQPHSYMVRCCESAGTIFERRIVAITGLSVKMSGCLCHPWNKEKGNAHGGSKATPCPHEPIHRNSPSKSGRVTFRYIYRSHIPTLSTGWMNVTLVHQASI